MSIKLGSTVKDQISGLTGIAIQRIIRMNGNVQIAIQPKMAEGGNALPEAWNIDHHTVVVVDEGVSANEVQPEEMIIQLGQTVRDKVTGFSGIATSQATYINGCVSFFVESKHRTKLGVADQAQSDWFDYNRLEVVDDGLLADAESHVKTAKPKSIVPGGPAQRTVRSAR